jgi:hypothetical protein
MTTTKHNQKSQQQIEIGLTITEQLVQLLVVTNGQLEMTGHDTLLLVIPRRIPSEFENLGREVFEDGCEVDGGARTDALCVVSALQHAVDTTDGELSTRGKEWKWKVSVVGNGEDIDEK